MYRTLYDILGVGPHASFAELKKAYYEQAKLCHPDINGDTPEMTAAFQRLVNAFDILSDPETRRRYDDERTFVDAPAVPQCNSFHVGSKTILDTVADDILEELVVGNDITCPTTLQNLMLDLTRTERFIMFREAKVALKGGKPSVCFDICCKLVDLSPANILYHYFLAESARALGKHTLAIRHYRQCLAIGYTRIPPQRLERVRRHYQSLLKKQGWIGKFLAWFMGPPPESYESEAEKSQRLIDGIVSQGLAKKKRHLNTKYAQKRPKLIK